MVGVYLSDEWGKLQQLSAVGEYECCEVGKVARSPQSRMSEDGGEKVGLGR
ncbi:MAG: hypothetical protein PUP93_31110 [Rhizonema sp. NSF051]|nr:hypothetical protein [Rhizonema sp. NSF051]